MQGITISVPACPAYLALAVSFLNDCKTLAESNPLPVDLQPTRFARANTDEAAVLSTGIAAGEIEENNGDTIELDLPIADAAEAFATQDMSALLSTGIAAQSEPEVAAVEFDIEHAMVPEKAGNLQLDDFTRQGWTLPQLIEHGYVREIKTPKPKAAPVPPAPMPAAAAPVTTAPMAPTPSLSTPAQSGASGTPKPTVELDNRGLPWDERLHASTKTKTTKGEWTYKRNLDRTIIPGVEAELLAMVASGKVAAVVPPAAPAPAPAPAPAASALGGPVALIRKITAAMNANPMINEGVIQRILKFHNVPAMNQLHLPAHAEAVAAITHAMFHPDGSPDMAWINTIVAQNV